MGRGHEKGHATQRYGMPCMRAYNLKCAMKFKLFNKDLFAMTTGHKNIFIVTHCLDLVKVSPTGQRTPLNSIYMH